MLAGLGMVCNWSETSQLLETQVWNLEAEVRLTALGVEAVILVVAVI